jgi:hypothetical protein
VGCVDPDFELAGCLIGSQPVCGGAAFGVGDYSRRGAIVDENSSGPLTGGEKGYCSAGDGLSCRRFNTHDRFLSALQTNIVDGPVAFEHNYAQWLGAKYSRNENPEKSPPEEHCYPPDRLLV